MTGRIGITNAMTDTATTVTTNTAQTISGAKRFSNTMVNDANIDFYRENLPRGWIDAYYDGSNSDNGITINAISKANSNNSAGLMTIFDDTDNSARVMFRKAVGGSTTYDTIYPIVRNKMYRGYFPDGQHLDSDWIEKRLSCTQRDNSDASTFQAHANGVTLKRAGLYVITAGLGIRYGSEGQEIILGLRHMRGTTVMTAQNIRMNDDDYDSGGCETMFIIAEANDWILCVFNGTSTGLQTMFAPDESYFTAVYLGPA